MCLSQLFTKNSFDSSILFRVLNEQFNSWLRENNIDTTGKQQMDVIVIIMVTFIKKKIEMKKINIRNNDQRHKIILCP